MNRKIPIGLCVLGLVVLLSAPSALAWSINPAKWTIYCKDDYEIQEKTWPLEIDNNGDTAITVKLTVKNPEYTYEGYEPMPTLSWISLSEKEFTLQGGEKKRITITLDVENASENYNQSYEFWIFADQTAGAGNIQTDYNCRWMYIAPRRYIPIEERPGYFNMNILYGIVLLGIGGLVVVLYLAKKGAFKRTKMPKKKPLPATSNNKPISMREQKRIEKDEEPPEPIGKPRPNIIQYKKRNG